MKMLRQWILLLGISGIAFGCASARMNDRASDDLFARGQYDSAATSLINGYHQEGEDGRDALLYLLDIGLALHSAGHYMKSIEYFLKADHLADVTDYTSLSTELATLVVSDNAKVYRGEDFEKVLINTFLAMNYAALGNLEDALVEARKVNHKLELFVTEGKKKYKQSAFARYLSALLYEAEGNWNDAYVDYKNTRSLLPDYPGLGQDLFRAAKALRINDEADEWRRIYRLNSSELEKLTGALRDPKRAEIVVVYENGISPIKVPHPSFEAVPKFFPRHNPVRSARVEVDGADAGRPYMLEDVEAVAIANLDEKYAGILAKKAAGLLTKAGIGYAVGRAVKSDVAGFLTGYLLAKADSADCRSWNLLPRDLQILRIPIQPGSHKIQVFPEGAAALPPRVVQVAPAKKIFVNFRYTP